MVEFEGGPADGHYLSLRRAPVYLRVVTGPRGGSLDALDRWADEPEPHELIHVYRRVGKAIVVFIRPGGRRVMAKYEYLAEQPPDEVARDKNRWRGWAIARYAEDRKPKPSTEG